MTAELAAVVGLTALPFVTFKLLSEFREAENMMEEAGLTLSMLFVVGLTYTGYGIANNNSLANASDAYLVSALIATVLFIGVMIQLVKGYMDKTQEDNEFGYFGNQ